MPSHISVSNLLSLFHLLSGRVASSAFFLPFCIFHCHARDPVVLREAKLHRHLRRSRYLSCAFSLATTTAATLNQLGYVEKGFFPPQLEIQTGVLAFHLTKAKGSHTIFALFFFCIACSFQLPSFEQLADFHHNCRRQSVARPHPPFPSMLPTPRVYRSSWQLEEEPQARPNCLQRSVLLVVIRKVRGRRQSSIHHLIRTSIRPLPPALVCPPHAFILHAVCKLLGLQMTLNTPHT
mmetsp:Transcript_26936/g.69260  ORF Transcript_26936/g.69260 Transcript_26936/m.69260 type:complete len:236 (+) Transcript_26936:807-1514(+)